MTARKLDALALVLLSLGVSGCCRDAEDLVDTKIVSGVISGVDLDQLRSEHDSDEARCEAACRSLNDEGDTEGGVTIDAIESCVAGSGSAQADPWAPTLDQVPVDCRVRYSTPGCCGGDAC